MIQINPSYKYDCPFDFSAPILPGKGIGSLLIGSRFYELKDWIVYSFFIKNIDDVKVDVFNGLFIHYTVRGFFDFVVDSMEGKIIRIGCSKGYLGFLDNKIHPGSLLSEILNYKKGFYIRDGMIVNEEIKGLEIDIPELYSDYDKIDDIPDYEIQRIFVVNR